MPRLVDGDNLLGTWPGRSRSEADKLRLIRSIRAFARRAQVPVVVVFDGPAPGGLAAGPDAVFSGPGRSADEVILSLVRSETDRRGCIVVTHDRSLADRCRHLGARIESPRAFREKLASPAAGDKPEGPVDVDDWREWFEEPR